jgi:hypothetical protein
MAIPNHNLPFLPVRGGIGILNPNVGKPGTLGCLLTTDGTDRWLLSCHHVLQGKRSPASADGERVFQPNSGEQQIAVTSATRSDESLDCAVAQLLPNISAVGEILGLPPLLGISEPALGMRVLKSGSHTGLTEGVIESVAGNNVEIAVPSDFDLDYELSGEGDSGAVWVCRGDMTIVALHKGGSAYGTHLAYGTKMSAVLAFLGLRLVF